MAGMAGTNNSFSINYFILTIFPVNNFELDNHPLTLHRQLPTSIVTSSTSTVTQSAPSTSLLPLVSPVSVHHNHPNGISQNSGVANQSTSIANANNSGKCFNEIETNQQVQEQILLIDELELTKLDFTYQLIKHTLNRQLQLTVRRWHSDWELAPSIFLPISSVSGEKSSQTQSTKVTPLPTPTTSALPTLVINDTEGMSIAFC